MPSKQDKDGTALLACSFCNVVLHNCAACLGSRGGPLISQREADTPDLDWACPVCWQGAINKAKQASSRVVGAKRRGGGGVARGRGRARGNARGRN